MKFDMRLITGIFIGMILGLHYVETFVTYLPILTVVTLVMILKLVHR
ncbi:MAG: hypothetical protein HYZ84_02005 [Candidatus Omnitrophica bacterium]|nr:hypothetical protein [Candidatus Omnitrophota bacterium]